LPSVFFIFIAENQENKKKLPLCGNKKKGGKKVCGKAAMKKVIWI